MSKRKPTPRTPANQSLDDLVAGEESTVSRKVETTKRQQNKTEPKTKATFYITYDLSDDIDTTHAKLRRMTRGSRTKPHKSDLATVALQMAMEELNRNGDGSEVLRRIKELVK